MKKLLTAAIAMAVCGAQAAEEFTATLAGHALLPAETYLDVPEDAPADLKVSGKFTTGVRVDELGSVEGKSDGRPTGVSLPFKGQPVQGHSGIVVNDDGSVWLLTDNGFGSKANSPDTALFWRRYQIDFDNGTFEPLETVFLHDPDKVVPQRIVHEGTESRYLTGSDFDLESIQVIDGNFWLGEEFGPYLIKADKDGKVLALYETVVDGKVVQSPDNPALSLPRKPDGELPEFSSSRSKGFEGMAAAPDGSMLYPLLEGALYDAEKGEYENVDGKNYLRILAFDPAKGEFTGTSWRYVLDENAYAIGDFNMIDAEYGLIIERDNLEGTADKACAEGAEDTTQCFAKPAQFKRVYKLRLPEGGGDAEKVAYIDLMNIQDPNGVARKPLNDGVFTFPFFTIENVDVIDEQHIVVGNDNNLPFSSSREPNQADDNELILLDVGDFLKH